MAHKRSVPTGLRYPAVWEDQYKKHRRVDAWRREWPERFGKKHKGKRRPGTLQYFAQYALMYLLWKKGIQSITWLHIAQVDRKTREKVRAGQSCDHAVPGSSAKRARIQQNWDVMRTLMGTASFDKLQTRIVRAGFSSHTGEPDLFCYTRGGQWFFVEAKTTREPLGAHQQRWFRIARRMSGGNCRIYVCRVVRGD